MTKNVGPNELNFLGLRRKLGRERRGEELDS